MIFQGFREHVEKEEHDTKESILPGWISQRLFDTTLLEIHQEFLTNIDTQIVQWRDSSEDQTLDTIILAQMNILKVFEWFAKVKV